MLLGNRIEEIRNRCEAATPGPWNHDCGFVITTLLNDEAPRNTDRAFIANARQDIPDLLDTIEALMYDVSGYCATCEFFSDCAKHDNNDAAPSSWYYGDCEDWQWHGKDEALRLKSETERNKPPAD